jgi:hypothetical protein
MPGVQLALQLVPSPPAPPPRQQTWFAGQSVLSSHACVPPWQVSAAAMQVDVRPVPAANVVQHFCAGNAQVAVPHATLSVVAPELPLLLDAAPSFPPSFVPPELLVDAPLDAPPLELDEPPDDVDDVLVLDWAPPSLLSAELPESSAPPHATTAAERPQPSAATDETKVKTRFIGNR